MEQSSGIDQFHPKKKNEEVLEPEISYLNVTSTLMYLTQCTRTVISSAINLLAYSFKLYWNGIKHVFRYIRGTINLGLP